MKKLLILTTFLLGLLLSGIPEMPDSGTESASTQEEVMKQAPSPQHSVEQLSKDLKSCNFLTPRRNIQIIHNIFQAHGIKHIQKTLRACRIKGDERLCKILEFNTYCETIKLSSLLSRRGYHIYALRKIVI